MPQPAWHACPVHVHTCIQRYNGVVQLRAHGVSLLTFITYSPHLLFPSHYDCFPPFLKFLSILSYKDVDSIESLHLDLGLMHNGAPVIFPVSLCPLSCLRTSHLSSSSAVGSLSTTNTVANRGERRLVSWSVQ